MATSDLVTEAQVDALSAAVATAVNAEKVARGTLASLTTTDKSSVVAAINEVKGAAGASINDAAPSLTTVYSSTKTNAQIAAATAALVAASPGALDTLNELAAALGNDANFATTTAAALGNRVRVDAAQALTAPQKAQALTNLGVARSTADFAAAFNAAVA